MPVHAPVIERASPDDLLLLSCDVGPVPLVVGAVLVLAAGPDFDVGAAQAVIGERIETVPRLRQRLVRLPPGCGRPVWIDDAGFDLGAHVRSVTCQPPGDDAALLAAACALLAEPLPWSRPLWSATFVRGLSGSRTAIVVVFHHVLADGIGGLAVLASLVDGACLPGPAPFPRPAPRPRQLAAEALGARVAALGRSAASMRRLPSALVELNPGGVIRPGSTMLNGPTGAGRRITVSRAGLDRLHSGARAHGATVNDLALTAITRALSSLAVRRGERPREVVASVMVGGRVSAAATGLGNVVGVMPVRLPADGDRSRQLERIAAVTREHKVTDRGASAGLLRPGFALLARLGLMKWFINHQRLVNVFVTNLRGPASPQQLCGAVITDVLPVALVAGNVSLSFGVMSYAGSLVVVIVADPALNPDLDFLAESLQAELDAPW